MVLRARMESRLDLNEAKALGKTSTVGTGRDSVIEMRTLGNLHRGHAKEWIVNGSEIRTFLRSGLMCQRKAVQT